METLTFRVPRLLALILIVVIATGLSAIFSTARQEDPTITNLFATITTVYPGADPGRVEPLVTIPIEEKLREIPEVDEVNSTSSAGVSVIQVLLLDTLTDDEIQIAWTEIRDALNDAAATFPPGVAAPEFSNDEVGAFAAIVALVPKAGEHALVLTDRYAEELADRLRNISNTKLVQTYGSPQEEILVRVDPEKAAVLGLTADQIAAAVEAADAKVSAGRLRGQASDMVMSVSGEITGLERIHNVVVRRSADGTTVYLGDIADISRGMREPVGQSAYLQGERAILVAARAQDGVQIDVWTDKVKNSLSSFEKQLPAGIEAKLVFDQSIYTSRRLTDVAINMAIGVALVVGVLFFTLGWRSAMIVATALPIVSLASVATMNAIGLEIHQMSVTGLIVALGLLVDAAIVMIDEVARRLSGGASRLSAVRGSVRRLAAPLLASTVTTALAFTPMILLPGPAGDFVGSIAIAVVTMLVWSFVIAMVVTPALAGRLLPRDAAENGMQAGLIGRIFALSIRWSVANPVRSIFVALILPVLGFSSMPFLTAQFFPGVDRDQFYIEVEMREGTALEDTTQMTRDIDALLRKVEGIEQVVWVVGRSAPAFYYNMLGNRRSAPHYAQALVTTASDEATSHIVPMLQNRVRSEFAKARVMVRDLVQGPPVEAPLELRLIGSDVGTLRALGEEAGAIMAELPTVIATRMTVTEAAPKVVVDIDEAKARALGLDLRGISRQLEAALEGVTGGTMIEGDRSVPVRVRFGTDARDDLLALGNIPVLPAGAQANASTGGYPALPLSAISELRIEPSEKVITRRDGERVNTVQAYLAYGILPEEALKYIQARIADGALPLPNGYRIEYGGDSDARAETLANLLATMGVIGVLTFATIVLTFNSFRVSLIALTVMPLSAGLSILSLAVFDYPFGIQAIIGIIGSIGVSINAAIILLTALQEDSLASTKDRVAVADVILKASRHIVSTTITTFGGFLPLILEGGGFWPPFAMSIAGGVLLSTIVSFYFTPPMFMLIARKKKRSDTLAVLDADASAAKPALAAE